MKTAITSAAFGCNDIQSITESAIDEIVCINLSILIFIHFMPFSTKRRITLWLSSRYR